MLKNDFSIFYKDLQAIPYFAGGGVAQGMPHSISTCPMIIFHPSRRPLWQRAYRCAGSKEYFNLSESAGDAGKLARNILWWLTDDASTNQGQGNDRTNRYEDALERRERRLD